MITSMFETEVSDFSKVRIQSRRVHGFSRASDLRIDDRQGRGFKTRLRSGCHTPYLTYLGAAFETREEQTEVDQ